MGLVLWEREGTSKNPCHFTEISVKWQGSFVQILNFYKSLTVKVKTLLSPGSNTFR